MSALSITVNEQPQCFLLADREHKNSGILNWSALDAVELASLLSSHRSWSSGRKSTSSEEQKETLR